MGREEITEQDILLAAELALPHRLKRHPFQDTEQAMQVLSEKLQQVEKADAATNGHQQKSDQQNANPESSQKKAKRG